MKKRDFKGVWFPADLWLDKNIRPLHKMFLLEIDSLNDPKQGCYASNAHFSQMFGVTKGRCTQIIKELEVDGLVTIKLVYSGKQIKKRIIRVVNKLNRGSEYIKLPYLENAEGSNNNKAVITKERAFSDFYDSYAVKKGRESAYKAWGKLSESDRILAINGISAFKGSLEKWQSAPYPATYLNQKRWTDEPESKAAYSSEDCGYAQNAL